MVQVLRFGLYDSVTELRSLVVAAVEMLDGASDMRMAEPCASPEPGVSLEHLNPLAPRAMVPLGQVGRSWSDMSELRVMGEEDPLSPTRRDRGETGGQPGHPGGAGGPGDGGPLDYSVCDEASEVVMQCKTALCRILKQAGAFWHAPHGLHHTSPPILRLVAGRRAAS